MIGGVTGLRNLRVCHSSVSLARRIPRRPFCTICTSAPAEDLYIDQVKGKSFHCTQCGKCCTVSHLTAGHWTFTACTCTEQSRLVRQEATQLFGCNTCPRQCGVTDTVAVQGAGEIWIDQEDVLRLAKKVNIQKEHFLSRYVKSYSRKPGYWLLRNANGTQVDSLAEEDSFTDLTWCWFRALFMALFCCDNSPNAGLHLPAGHRMHRQ